ncbi:MAG: hypothetical protein FVQ85_17030 [Planctomycetes bacterium]|nr:hypothetical protein [Planctomycetota bacterium]
MKSKYHKWIFLGLFFAAVTVISFWGKWGAIVVVFIIFFIFSRYCLPTWWYIYGKKPKKENKKHPNQKHPGKMTYLYWSNENERPVAKVIGEKEQKKPKVSQ